MENFAQLLEEYSNTQEMNHGEVITAEVVDITDKFVIVNAGLKSESLIDIAEFKNPLGELEAKVGDFVTVTIESVENGFGETKQPSVLPIGLRWKRQWKTASSCPASSTAK